MAGAIGCDWVHLGAIGCNWVQITKVIRMTRFVEIPENLEMCIWVQLGAIGCKWVQLNYKKMMRKCPRTLKL